MNSTSQKPKGGAIQALKEERDKYRRVLQLIAGKMEGAPQRHDYGSNWAYHEALGQWELVEYVQKVLGDNGR